MLTKQQKQDQVKESVKALKDSGSVLLADFSKVSISEMTRLRKILRDAGARFQVLKKRLLKIAFQEAGVDFDPTRFAAQTGTIFISKDALSVAGPVYELVKELEKKGKVLTVLGGFDLKDNREITAQEFVILAKLPSREILLAQIAIAFSMPIKQLAYALNSRKEQLEK